MDHLSELILIFLVLLNRHPMSTKDIEFHNINSPLLPLYLGKTCLIETYNRLIYLTTLVFQLANKNKLISHKLRSILKYAHLSRERNQETIIYNKFSQVEYLFSTVKTKFNNIISKRREKRSNKVRSK